MSIPNNEIQMKLISKTGISAIFTYEKSTVVLKPTVLKYN
ncbi:hypothetical protein PspKH34_18540 [Parageobacillus sp. KH3-4]|jgi:hypothetical protein|nr:hypothetical protein PspKH34_18540 [Parageobacillus sp. KH3-4]